MINSSFYRKYSTGDIFLNNKNIVIPFCIFWNLFASLYTTAHTNTKNKSLLHILKQNPKSVFMAMNFDVCLSKVCQFLEFISKLRNLVIKVFHTFSLLDKFISKLVKSIHIFRILNTHNYAKCVRKQNRVIRRCYRPRLRTPLLTAQSTILNWMYESY